jgi:hypothetical protein
MENVVHLYNGILFSYKKENATLPFSTTGMDLESFMLTEISQAHEGMYS